MHRIPRDKGLDSTLALLHNPYRFIARRCRLHGSDLFETRLLLRKTLCMSGAEAARLFYDPERFVRHGAMPPRLQKTLFGVGGVQGLDGEAHRHRKHMFVALLMDAERVAQLVEAVRGEWRTCARRWERMEKVVLYDAPGPGFRWPRRRPDRVLARSLSCSTTPDRWGRSTGVRVWRAGGARPGWVRWSSRSGPAGGSLPPRRPPR